jgi:hypothetical protein
LEEIQKDGKSTGLFTEISNDGARSTDSLLDTTIIIELGKPTPGTKVLSGLDHDNMDFTFGTETLDELLVLVILAILGEATETGRAAIQSLGALVKTLLESSVDHGLFEDLIVMVMKVEMR